MAEKGTGIDRLVRAITDLTTAEDLAQVQAVVRSAGRELVGSDGLAVALRDADEAYYLDEDAIAPLWRGARFPLTQSVAGRAMLGQQHVVVPELAADPSRPGEADQESFATGVLAVPVRTSDPVGALTACWARPHTPTPEELHLLQALADATSVALDKPAVSAELGSLVALPGHPLAPATDDLTGVHNRRGFFDRAQELQSEAGRGAVALVEVVGVGALNEREGREAGEELLRTVADRLTRCLRDDDVVARLGGDDFAVLSTGLDADRMRSRLLDRLGGVAHIGTADVPGPDRIVDSLLLADAARHTAKRTRAERSA
ncbi:sensor domain-containing diguanylate cyclase [Nocardioides sp. zg-536]|uniref:Sensor domain-containing diguanylate cyclase n=1 Tax=Nocardioides faecalis TaxID=2803858 RepID=A0A939BSD9_9ACTN|nr:sensor domain-containing diguanylate cyclase [Nocardioides faecalis]MBM9459534.1 sensor domain-containing diguanylate cyclase [Nocardioides faecalis]MBS4753686.1 sensor domain-containing diguanylate cyclase [Nocardioides faecalis]QVI58067.1 sensor domain-containing diguanylate cyclase [Nocardioides faecalis]